MREPLVTYRGVVYPWHCDHVGHMNVMWYTGKFDEASWHLFAHIGITPSYLRLNDRGMVAVRQVIEYKLELVAGDLVFVRSRMLAVGRSSLRFESEMVNAETREVAAVSELTGVHLDRTARTSRDLPLEIADRARGMLV